MIFSELSPIGGTYIIKNTDLNLKKHLIANNHIPSSNLKHDVADGFNDIFQKKYYDGFNVVGSDHFIFKAVTGQNTGNGWEATKERKKCFRSLKLQTITDTPDVLHVRIKWTYKKGSLYYANDGDIHCTGIDFQNPSGIYFGDRIKQLNERISGIFSGIRVVDFCELGDGRFKVYRPETKDYVFIEITDHSINFQTVKTGTNYTQSKVQHEFYKDFFKKLARLMAHEVKAINFLKIK